MHQRVKTLSGNKDYYSYIKNGFKKWAFIYDVWAMPISGVRHKVVDFINAKDNSKVLDVCTGTGKQAFAFGKRGYNVVGIDFSEDMLRIANKKNKYDSVQFKIADATCIPFKENYFDVSCISFALHDMPPEVREKVLAELTRVTEPEGNIAIVDYALPDSRIGSPLIYYLVKFYESKYYPEFIKFDLSTLIRKYGIEIEKEIKIMFGGVRILKGINRK